MGPTCSWLWGTEQMKLVLRAAGPPPSATQGYNEPLGGQVGTSMLSDATDGFVLFTDQESMAFCNSLVQLLLMSAQLETHT